MEAQKGPAVTFADRARVEIEDLGDVGVGQPLEGPHEDNLAVIWGEARDRLTDTTAQLSAGEALARAGRAGAGEPSELERGAVGQGKLADDGAAGSLEMALA